MSFEITIKETRIERKLTGRQWAQIAETYTSQEDIDKAAYKSDIKPGALKAVYGYTPEVEKNVEETRTVLSQVVDELDLVAVIRAINGIA